MTGRTPPSKPRYPSPVRMRFIDRGVARMLVLPILMLSYCSLGRTRELDWGEVVLSPAPLVEPEEEEVPLADVTLGKDAWNMDGCTPEQQWHLEELHMFDELGLDQMGSTTLIVGGCDATGGELIQGYDVNGWQYPWMASLRDSQDNHVCGGTLIDSQVVLTAAHCLDEHVHTAIPSTVDVGRRNRVGDEDSEFQKYEIEYTITHEDYSVHKDFDCDIALIILKTPTGRKFVHLAENADCFESTNGCKLYSFGWGILDYAKDLAHHLQVVSPPTMNKTECEKHRPGQTISANMLCAGNIEEGGIGNCKGDSGGPAFILQDGIHKQVGVVSWSNGCGDAYTPEVMVSIPKMRAWIFSQTANIGNTSELSDG